VIKHHEGLENRIHDRLRESECVFDAGELLDMSQGRSFPELKKNRDPGF
jgi:hypothetical protein